MASYLLDTIIVLRLIDREDPQHRLCRAAVDTLIERHVEVCLAPQVLVEFWVVATRPSGSQNGLGWDTDKTDVCVSQLRQLFRLRPECPELFDRWQQLARDFGSSRNCVGRICSFFSLKLPVFPKTFPLCGQLFSGTRSSAF